MNSRAVKVILAWLVGLCLASNAVAEQNAQLQAFDQVEFEAVGGPAESVILGAAEPSEENADTGFKFQLELTSKGAAIGKATFSNGPDEHGGPTGFNDRDYKTPQPLVILAPLSGGILSMANKEFVLVDQKRQLRLDGLSWKSSVVERSAAGWQVARFEAFIKAREKDTSKPIVKLVKTYKVIPGSYMLDCSLTVENLSDKEQKVRFNLAGPVGIGREGVRGDMRNVVGGFRTSEGEVVSSRTDLTASFFGKLLKKEVGLKGTSAEYEKALQSRNKAMLREARANLNIGRNLPNNYKGAQFLWAAISNKYFTAILRPVPAVGKDHSDWLRDETARFYNPDRDDRGYSGDETVGVDLEIAAETLSAAGQAGSTKKYNFQLYLGPKDKSLFYKNELYRSLGFANTITFMPCCCCPANVIRPLAFGILALMKWMYGFIGNYGVVIIVLVFLFRLCLHPITKKSQVSMSKFSKVLGSPEVREIRKKYAKNQVEMNRRILAFQKERGISPVTPIMGMLPMMVQMPIWISLWSAVYASIELRGAAFLPFWITDLSVPDALVRFSAITLPIFGKLDSFNLLPILMGVAFYLQQKLMPSQAAANPQAAQQQKMMMIMFPLMFPLMLYKAPSGVNLYIMASTFAGVIEQYVIRKHIREKEQAESIGLVAATSKTGGKVKKKKPKPFYKT